MRIALYDVDNFNKKKTAFPNLALMKISAYHKHRGDAVEWWSPMLSYDIVYKSKVFTGTPESDYIIQADKVISGGTGYDFKNALPDEIERQTPDYSLYPGAKEAYGFLTRGCPRKCPFCIVSQKEGCASKRVADLSEFHAGQRTIKLLDPNLLACNERMELLEQLVSSEAWIDFTQGLDIRLVDRDVVRMLKKMKLKMIHFAWDNPREDLIARFRRFKEESGIADYRKLGVYVLTNYHSTHEEDLWRIYTLRDLGYWPYVMIYDKATAPRETRLLQRWVNNRIIFAITPTFDEYNEKLG